jgi:hypothetical protein
MSALFCLIVVSGTIADDGTSDTKLAPASTAQTLKGTLTITGEVTVNHKIVQTGATMVSGDLIITGPQADATIDLGPLGTVRLRPNTSLHLQLKPDNYELIVDRCGCITQTVPQGISAKTRTTIGKVVQVTVKEGEVWLDQSNSKSGKVGKKKLKLDKPETFHNVHEVNAEGGASYTVKCCQCCFVEKIRP